MNIDIPTLKTHITNLLFPARCVFCDSCMDFRTLYCVCNSCEEEIKVFYTADGCFMFIDKIRSSVLRFKFAKCTDYAQTFGLIMTAQLKLRLPPIPPLQPPYPLYKYTKTSLSSPQIKRRLAKQVNNNCSLLIVNCSSNLPFDVAVPIPLSKKRLKKRGYNQSALLAKVIAKELNIDFNDTTMIKIKETEIQSTLSKTDRAKNLKGVFTITDNSLKGKRILLIDDVRTTGATLEEATKVLLKQAKTSSVFPWVFARVDT